MIARLADVNFCPTELSKQNLIDEKVQGECHVVGNTVLDSLLPYKDKCEYTSKVLVRLHRRENHHQMDQWFTEVNNLAKDNPEIMQTLMADGQLKENLADEQNQPMVEAKFGRSMGDIPSWYNIHVCVCTPNYSPLHTPL